MGVQGASHNSGSSGHSSMEASQSPSVSNSAATLMRQSSTVSGEAKHGSSTPSSSLQVLKAAAARAEKWKAEASAGTAGVPFTLFPILKARFWSVGRCVTWFDLFMFVSTYDILKLIVCSSPVKHSHNQAKSGPVNQLCFYRDSASINQSRQQFLLCCCTTNCLRSVC